jgi:hypothetical protein
MSAYHKRNRDFEDRLAVKADELKASTVTSDERGRVVISALPAYTFASREDAVRFLKRVTRTRRSQ